MSYLDNKIEIHEKVLEILSRQVKFLVEMNENDKKLNTTNHPEVKLPIAISIIQEETNQTHVHGKVARKSVLKRVVSRKSFFLYRR